MTLDRVRELADGRAHLAADAKTMGLIDGIGSFDQTLTKMQSIIQRRTGNMQASLSETAVDAALTVELTAPPAPVVVTETPQPKAASYAEIVAACVGCDPSFICGQLAAGVTVAAAQSAWMAEQNERIKAAIAKPGVEPIGTKPSAAGNQSGDVVSDWEAAVETFTAKGKTKQQAILAADRKFPGLREAMLAQVNQ
jgi:ClpP class serine protease